MKTWRIVWSWDFLSALSISILFAYRAPASASNELAKDYYGVGISVLSVVFSIFFAALALIIAASDDEFVAFLEEEGNYSAILFNFRFTLGLLFCALVYSIVSYAYTAERISQGARDQGRKFLILFCFLFLWSLFATFASTWDAVRYSDYRRRFIAARRNSKGP